MSAKRFQVLNVGTAANADAVVGKNMHTHDGKQWSVGELCSPRCPIEEKIKLSGKAMESCQELVILDTRPCKCSETLIQPIR